MHNSFRHRLTLAAILLTVGFIPACDNSVSKNSNLHYDLRSHFESLYIAKHGKDYPYTNERLEKCRKINYQPCLKAYEVVNNARQKLASLPKDKALEETLNMLPEDCLSKDENISNFVCHGGIMSLFFYAAVEQDKIIFNAIKKYPVKVQEVIFNNEYAWYSNRPDPSKWVQYISTLNMNWEPETQKSFVIKLFKNNISQLEPKPGLMVNKRGRRD